MPILIDLTLIWGMIIAFGIVMYVLLDGFDLGVGILFPLIPVKEQRDVMMGSVAPVWDGNETWLVLGGVSLFGAFPLAYSILLPALYVPVMLMLMALILRGVSFEFRFKADDRHRAIWDRCFSAGSFLAAFAQGVMLGAFVQGFEVADGAYAGGPFDWFGPFSAMTGFALVFGYALLGATWLIIKTEGALQDWSYAVAMRLLYVVIGFLVLVSLWTPLLSDDIADRWFSWPNVVFLAELPLVSAIVAVNLWWALRRRREVAPFAFSTALFLLAYMGVVVTLFPYAVPRTLTLWDAAARPESQIFLLIGVTVLLPIILSYTAYAYGVFRGKASGDEGYH